MWNRIIEMVKYACHRIGLHSFVFLKGQTFIEMLFNVHKVDDVILLMSFCW